MLVTLPGMISWTFSSIGTSSRLIAGGCWWWNMYQEDQCNAAMSFADSVYYWQGPCNIKHAWYLSRPLTVSSKFWLHPPSWSCLSLQWSGSLRVSIRPSRTNSEMTESMRATNHWQNCQATNSQSQVAGDWPWTGNLLPNFNYLPSVGLGLTQDDFGLTDGDLGPPLGGIQRHWVLAYAMVPLCKFSNQRRQPWHHSRTTGCGLSWTW